MFTKPKTGKETDQVTRRSKTNFPGSVALGFEKQQAQDQIPQMLMPAGGEYTYVAEPKGTAVPPDPACGNRNRILVYKDIPAEGVNLI